jgi:proteic killer suppression protein
VIASFKSKALRRYWTKGELGGLRPDWHDKVRLILSRLDLARHPSEMNAPGFGFHALKGFRPARFAASVSRNWRITFAWDGEDATDVDLEDYHGS